MNISRNEKILIALFGLLILAAIIKFAGFFQKSATAQDATNFVLDDLTAKYPNSEIEIMNIANKTNSAGSSYFEVKARVTSMQNTPCPERVHIFYNYPIQNFVPQTPEVITKDCRVCTDGLCNIAFKEEAIIASHTLNGTTEVQNYLMQNTNSRSIVRESNESWAVDWLSNQSDYGYEVVIHRAGTILNVVRIPSTQVN